MAQEERTLVGLATCAEFPALHDDDRRLQSALTAAGVGVEPVVWSDANADWRRFDIVVVRSCWDYYLSLGSFLEWIAHLEGLGVRLHNAPALLRWNVSKRYLTELAQRGVRVVPTLWLDADSAVSADPLHAAREWHRIVVKPGSSANSYDTWSATLPLSPDEDRRLRDMAMRGDVMVQAFMSEIQSEGEWSMVFLGQQFSHGVIKKPSRGEFRVQERLGGIARAASPPAWLVRWGHEVISLLPEPPLYARVDALIQGSDGILMELELVEPSLFFSFAPGSETRLASLITTGSGLPGRKT